MAEPDSQQVGPYTVSFNLDSDYQIQIAEPMQSDVGTVYSMALFVDNSTGASIAIAEYAEPTDATSEHAGGYLSGSFPCYRVYRTRDGRHMALGAVEPVFWADFCQAVGRPDLIGADGVHPTDGGHAYMAAQIAPLIYDQLSVRI